MIVEITIISEIWRYSRKTDYKTQKNDGVYRLITLNGEANHFDCLVICSYVISLKTVKLLNIDRMIDAAVFRGH